MKIQNKISPLFFMMIMTIGFIAQSNEIFFIPSHPQPKAPLFVALHGCMGEADSAESSMKLSELGEKYGFYIFYPEPILGSKAKDCFDFYDGKSQKPGVGDSAEIVRRVQNYTQEYDINPEKIFVMGMSGGASLVSVLTACYPNVFKGAAIHSGMGYGYVSNWEEALLVTQTGPTRLLERNKACDIKSYKGKVFLIHGSSDQIMSPRHFDALQIDYLSKTQKTDKKVYGDFDHYSYVKTSYRRNKREIGRSVYVLGMGHEWSGMDPDYIFQSRGPDVSSMIVDFFLAP